MKIKVIIKDGIVRFVLKDQDTPVHVELIDTSDSATMIVKSKNTLSHYFQIRITLTVITALHILTNAIYLNEYLYRGH